MDCGLIRGKMFIVFFNAHFTSAYQEPNLSGNMADWNGWEFFDKCLSSEHQDWLNRPFNA